jgi:SAM-dependent methyltransferase
VRVLRPPSDAALQTYEAEAEVGAHAPGPLPPDEGRLHAALLRHEQLLLRVRAALDGAAPGRPLRLLDIGSGWGDRLAAARWAGFEVVGVEPDPRRRRWMERRLGPLPVVESLAELDAEPFDVVLFGGCVEEEDEGILLLDGLGSLLAEGGLLVLHVDLLDHPIHRMRGYDDPIWARPNRRIWFERRTLAESLQVVGLAERAAWSDEQRPGGTWVLAGRAA